MRLIARTLADISCILLVLVAHALMLKAALWRAARETLAEYD